MQPTQPEAIQYTLDRLLRLVQVNAAFRTFAQENRGEAVLGSEPGGSILAAFSGRERLRWEALYAGLVAGELPSYEEVIPCPAPFLRRDYLLRIDPERDAEGRVQFLRHTLTRAALEGPSGPGTAANYLREVQGRPVASERLRTAHLLRPLEEAGGDFLWARELTDGSLALVIGDVMGHGLSAASLAVDLVRLLDSAVLPGVPPQALLADLNRVLHGRIRQGGGSSGPRFVTGLHLQVDPHGAGVQLCSFAHPGPIFSSAGPLDPPSGPPLGIHADAGPDQWPQVWLPFREHGHRFLAFTDGCTEQFDPAGEMLGVQRLAQFFRESLDYPVAEAVAYIDAQVEAHRGAALVKDDRAMLCVEAPD